MMSAALPTSDQLSNATALLVALSDPKAVQERIEQLKSATDQHEQARLASVQKIQDAANLTQQLEARLADIRMQEQAVNTKAASLLKQQADVDQAAKQLVDDRQAFEQECAQRGAAQDARESQLTSREAAVADNETRLAALQKTLETQQADLTERLTKLRALAG